MERVLQLRRKLGLTQKEFAEKLGVYQPEVSRMESDETQVLTMRQLHLISNAFNVSLRWLDEGAGDMFKQEPTQGETTPFIFALRQGFGNETALAFHRLCNLTPAQKEQIEKFFSDEKKRDFLGIINAIIGEPVPF